MLSREGCGEWGRQGHKVLGEAQNIRRQRWAGVCGDMEQRVSLGPAGYHRPSQTRVTSAHTYPMSTWAPSRRPEVLHQARLQLSICLRVTFCLRHRIPWCVGSAQGSPGRLPVAPAQAQQGSLAWGSSSTKQLLCFWIPAGTGSGTAVFSWNHPWVIILQLGVYPWHSCPAIHINSAAITNHCAGVNADQHQVRLQNHV